MAKTQSVAGVLAMVLVWACGGDPAVPDAAAGRDAAAACAAADDCDDERFCNGAEQCSGGTCEPGPLPCASSCDETSDTCDTSCGEPDADGDGFRGAACGGLDCDDADPASYPGNTEVCDVGGHDEDCDPATYGIRDGDADGWPDARCCNGTTCGTDCDDARGAVHPTQVDVCNGIDDDCDGVTDEGLAMAGWRADCDGDGHARDGGEVMTTCDAPAAPPAECAGAATAAWATEAGDCDDASSARYPGAIEVCDGIDNDCDAMLDGPGEDDDADGYADACAGAAATDCNDACPTCHPGAPALTGMCDALDHDCDGSVDEGTLRRWYRDVDGDGVGTAAVTADACLAPGGYVASAGDCNDGDGYTGACSAPLSCVRGIACGCEVTMLHGRDLFDIDTGDVRRTGVPGSAYDITVEWGSLVGMPPVPWYVRTGTGRTHQHRPFTQFSRVDASYATGLVTAPINEYFTPDRVILVRSSAGGPLYKLGHSQRITASDGYESIRFIYAPIGTPPPGFACAAPY